ncbi:hypothetical protein HALO59_150307 [Halomonas sp. 59]|nr:hypothetical protein HALO59_150307 [Halomonas sp. 59]CAD5259233.1 hypothetical protein HALO113_160310 [Halomonas sp. 113]CAD5273174.1 hypothetical protein HALOI3_200309 [Halomonas sp. I3]CAD5289471.1 hypothetical protein HALO156_40332 [Halomonas sp. 156]VXB33197.1 hypothetical protein HALO98_160305 [Halomonas titanicae]
MLAERLVVREERFFAVAHGRQLGAMAGFELLDSEGKPEQRSPVRSVPKPARKA